MTGPIGGHHRLSRVGIVTLPHTRSLIQDAPIASGSEREGLSGAWEVPMAMRIKRCEGQLGLTGKDSKTRLIAGEPYALTPNLESRGGGKYRRGGGSLDHEEGDPAVTSKDGINTEESTWNSTADSPESITTPYGVLSSPIHFWCPRFGE